MLMGRFATAHMPAVDVRVAGEILFLLEISQ